jgi:hypothetical protein
MVALLDCGSCRTVPDGAHISKLYWANADALGLLVANELPVVKNRAKSTEKNRSICRCDACTYMYWVFYV